MRRRSAMRYGAKKRSKPGGRRGLRKGRRSGRKGKSNPAKRAVMSTLREMKKLTAISKFLITWSYRATGTGGKAAMFPVCIVNDSADLKLIHDQLQFQLGYPSTAVLNKFATGNFTGQYKIASACNYNQTIVVYKIVARNQISIVNAPLVQFPHSTTQTANIVTYPDLTTTMLQGFNEEGRGGITTTTIPYGMTPFMSNKFCSQFKVVKTYKYKIRGGSIITVNVRHKKWNLWNGTDINGVGNSTATDAVGFRGRTVWYYMWMESDPVFGTVASDSVEPGKPDVGLIGTERYEFTGMTNANVIFPAIYNSLPPDVGGANNVVVERTGLPAVIANVA